ncbi:MAG: ribosome maturation factor RimM [Xenococcaceae cyanobacterium]
MNHEQLTTEWLEIGTIVSPQGLRGELRVYPNSDFPERFLEPGIRWLQHPQTGEMEAIELLGGRYLSGKNLYVIAIEGVENREQAEELRDHKILVDKSDRPSLEEDEYHVSDLINLEVYHQQTGENIGVIIDVFTAGNDLLEVKLHQQPVVETKPVRDLSQISRKSKRKKQKTPKNKPVTIFIPFVKEIVTVVDISNQRIEITPPEGLLEIN